MEAKGFWQRQERVRSLQDTAGCSVEGLAKCTVAGASRKRLLRLAVLKELG